LSTLTKILIVLLTLSSIFLCGIVVTYVANAADWKKQHDDLKREYILAGEDKKTAEEQLRQRTNDYEELEKDLKDDLARLDSKLQDLQVEFTNAEREEARLRQEVTDMATVVQTANQTAQQQTKLFEAAQAEVAKLLAERTKRVQKLKETEDLLIEKMVQIETLVTEKKRLIEEKTELETRLAKLLKPFEEGPTIPTKPPVTPDKGKVKPVPIAPTAIALQGLITKVDLKNSMAEISIGQVDGVKEGMQFHVARGDDFICDILIVDVDTETAVGELKLTEVTKKQPKAGDKVSTEL